MCKESGQVGLFRWVRQKLDRDTTLSQPASGDSSKTRPASLDRLSSDVDRQDLMDNAGRGADRSRADTALSNP